MSEQRFAERRRSEKWRRVRRVFLVLLGVGVVGGLVWVIWFSSALAVDRVQVEGTTTLKPTDIRSQAAVRLGRPLARVDTVAIESKVAAMARIDRVDVSRRWPSTIRIEVVERKPVAWVMSGISIRMLDRYGVDFRTVRSEPKNLVEVRVETISARKRQQSLESSTAVIDVLRTGDPGLLKQVQYVRVSSKDSVQLVLGKNRTVTWGSAAKGEQKLQVVRSLLKIKATDYDVSAPEQPTTRR
ncbi:cell division protein FtsQ/DivIB [Aeromicrobium sp.]|uniref:cell division protein FtsQ/DivIB n=1 Tax=Aeromicrobium sp. TaxID=1871063 RepID=UPI003D6AB0A9